MQETVIQNVCPMLSALASANVVSQLLKLQLSTAWNICLAPTVLSGEEREQARSILQQLGLKSAVWELVLNSISPGKVNNLPHRFYGQFLGFDVLCDTFRPKF